jgi:hypothetical protein
MRNRRHDTNNLRSFAESIDRLAQVSVQDEDTRPGLETNPAFRGSTLIGQGAEYPGQLESMRRTDPVVAPAMDFLHAEFRAIELDVEPPDSPTPEEIRATEDLRHMLRTGVRGGIQSLFARVADRWITSGFAANEIIQRPSRVSGRWWDVEFFSIAPWSIDRIRTTSNGSAIEEIEQTGARGRRARIPARKLSWCANMPESGAFMGYSLLRPALAVCLWYETLVKNGLNRSLVDRGVPVLRQAIETGATEAQIRQLDAWADDYVDGAIGPLRLPHGYELEMFTPASAADNPLPMLQHLDALKRQVTATTLATLGTSATGSRALGEAFAVSDRKRFSAWVGEILDDLNGHGDYPGGDIVTPMLVILGYSPRAIRSPVLVAPGFGRADLRDSLDSAITLIQRGMPVGADDWAALREAVGLPDQAADAAPTQGEPVPFDGARTACDHTHAADFARVNEHLPPLDAEEFADFDAVERLVDRAAESGTTTLQALSEGHRREFAAAVGPLIDAGDVAAIAALEIDYTSVYRADILDALERVDRSARRIQTEELRRAGLEINTDAPPVQYLPGEPDPVTRMRALASLKAEQVNDEVNDQLRQAALDAVDTDDDSTLLAFILPPTIAAGLITSAALRTLATAQDDEVRRVREGRPTLAVHTERMDAHTCEPCRQVHGRVYVVGSADYRRNKPPYRLCESVASATGNKCRGYLIYMEP